MYSHTKVFEEILFETDIISFLMSYGFYKAQNQPYAYAKEFRAYGHGFAMETFVSMFDGSVSIRSVLIDSEHYDDELCTVKAKFTNVQLDFGGVRPLFYGHMTEFENLCRITIIKKIFGEDFLKPLFEKYNGYNINCNSQGIETLFKRSRNITTLQLAEKHRKVWDMNCIVCLYINMFQLCSIVIIGENKQIVYQMTNIPYNVLCGLLGVLEEYMFDRRCGGDFYVLKDNSQFVNDLTMHKTAPDIEHIKYFINSVRNKTKSSKSTINCRNEKRKKL